MATPIESTWTNARGQRLHSIAYAPSTPRALVCFHHGYAEHIGRYHAVFSALSAKGLAVHSYDAHAHGRSEPLEEKKRVFINRFSDLVRASLLHKRHGIHTTPQCRWMTSPHLLPQPSRPTAHPSPAFCLVTLLVGWCVRTRCFGNLTCAPVLFSAPPHCTSTSTLSRGAPVSWNSSTNRFTCTPQHPGWHLPHVFQACALPPPCPIHRHGVDQRRAGRCAALRGGSPR